MKKIFLFACFAVLSVFSSLMHAQLVDESHSGIDFYVGSGLNAKDGATLFPFEAIFSKSILPGLSVGIGGGYELVRAGEANSSSIPVFLDGKVSLRLAKGVSSLSELRLGYSIGQDVEVKSGNKTYEFDGAKGFMIGVMPAGMRFSLGKCMDLDFALGVSLLIPQSGGKAETYFGGRLGFNFHKANKSINSAKSVTRVEKPKIIYPTRENGFEFGFDATGLNGFGAGFFLGYKLNPKLSFALGMKLTGGKGYALPKWTASYYSQADGEGEPFMEQSGGSDTDSFDETWAKFFIRGEYRFIDKRFSPIARLDIGYSSCFESANLKRYKMDGISENDRKKVGGISAHPAIGVSLRCSRNSYLEAVVGYEVIPGIKSIDEVFNSSGNYGGSGSKHYESIRLKEGGINVSGFTVGISWKHTTKLFSTTKPITQLNF